MSRSVSLGDVATHVLDIPLGQDAPPILAKRTSHARKIDEAKREERDAATLSRAKKALAKQSHHTLRAGATATDASLETKLRKIATRGVIDLFTSVRAQQREDAAVKPKNKRQRRAATAATLPPETAQGAPLDLSKDSFMDILRRGTAAGAGDGKTAPFLRDDYMLGKSKTKDWDRAVGNADDGAVGDDDDEAPDDFDDGDDDDDDEGEEDDDEDDAGP